MEGGPCSLFIQQPEGTGTAKLPTFPCNPSQKVTEKKEALHSRYVRRRYNTETNGTWHVVFWDVDLRAVSSPPPSPSCAHSEFPLWYSSIAGGCQSSRDLIQILILAASSAWLGRY